MARSRSIALRVRAEVADAVRGLGEVGRAAAGVGDKSDEAGRKSQTLGQRVTQSARSQSQDWRTVGTALTTYGAAVTGVGALVLTTGINYNSLRQTATQALTAITGSTEDATAQMRRLDEYGQNSWLMRDTLITAQQQMTGFGISTERVIPYMNALAEATAATGGNNQDFLEMSQIMGQIQSQGRITAEELRRFGVRGVDAASLIGDAMGMTAQQVRDEISTGAFDAGTALDALAAGMEERYGGASDLVRQTFRGAVDDVMAAFRDLSASLVTPLVDPEGGGILVDFLNNVADAMFALRDMNPIVRDTAAGIALLTGPLSLAAGGFLLLFPSVVNTVDSLARLGVLTPGIRDGIRSIGRHALPLGASFAAAGLALVALNAAGTALGEWVRRDHMSVEQLGGVINDLAAGAERAEAAFSDLDTPWFLSSGTHDFTNLENAAETLEMIANPNLIQRLQGALMPNIGTGWQQMEERLSAIGTQLTEMSQDNLPGAVDGFTELYEMFGGTEEVGLNLLKTMPDLRDRLADLAGAADLATDDATLLKIILGEISPEMLGLAGDTEELELALAGLSPEVEAMRQRWVEKSEAMREAREAMREGLGALFDWTDGLDASDLTMAGVIESIRDMTQATLDYEANIAELHSRGMPTEFVQEIEQKFGQDAPLVMALFADSTDEELAEAIAAWQGLDEQLDTSAKNLDDLLERDRAIEFELDVDDTPARTGFEDVVDDFNNTTTDTNLDLDPREAIGEFVDTVSDWESTTTPTMLSADPGPAIKIFNDETGAWERTTTETLLDLNENRAALVFDQETGRWERTMTDTLLGADDTPARATVTSLGGWAWRQRTQVNVTANTSTAAAQIRSLSGIRVTAHAAVARASGGPVFGPGSETSDSILAALSHNEHVISAAEVRGMGGHGAVEQIRAMARAGVRAFADGGTPAYQYRPSLQPAPAPSPAAASGPVMAVLAPEDRDLLAAVASRPVQVQMGRRTLAEATAVAGEYGRSRGQGRG